MRCLLWLASCCTAAHGFAVAPTRTFAAPSLPPRVPAAIEEEPQPSPPIDTKLLVTDTTLIFAFAFARTLCTILLSPDFPGWLAPISIDGLRFSSTLGFASIWSVLWSIAGVSLDGFFAPAEFTRDDEGMRRVGFPGAARCLSLAATAYCTLALMARLVCADVDLDVPLPLRFNLDNVEASLGLGLGLIAWRSFLAESTPR
jgi:hypothetical protein